MRCIKAIAGKTGEIPMKGSSVTIAFGSFEVNDFIALPPVEFVATQQIRLLCEGKRTGRANLPDFWGILADGMHRHTSTPSRTDVRFPLVAASVGPDVISRSVTSSDAAKKAPPSQLSSAA